MARNNIEMAVGLHKGHKTTKTVQKPKPSRRKGVRAFHSFFHSFGIVTEKCYLKLSIISGWGKEMLR